MRRKSKKKQSIYNSANSGVALNPERYYQKIDVPAVSLRVTGASSAVKKNNLLLNFLLLVFFDSGVFAALRIIKNFTDIVFDEPFVYIGALIFSVLLWIISQIRKVKTPHLLLAGIGVIALVFVIFSGKIMAQINIIIGLIIWSPPFINLVDITHTVLLCSMLGIFVFYTLTFCAGKGWLLILACAPLIIISAVLDIDIELLDLFLLGIYFVGSYTVGNVHNPSKRKKRKVHRLSPSERMSAGGSGAAILMALFLLFSILAYMFATPRMETLYEVPMTVESMVQQAISQVVDIQPDNGNVNRGNNYSFGQKHLEVTSSEIPQNALYLKNYTGGYYNNGRWNTVNENSFFVGSPEEMEYLRSYCNNIYYALNTDPNLETMTIGVHSLKSMITGDCVPVLSREISSENGWKTYLTYDLSALPYANTGDTIETYDEYVATTYMYVPEERVPRLVELCQNSGVRMGDYEEATSFIKNTFKNMVTYTTAPGNAPYGVDIAEYFLFDSGKGFCQQYATTAALMYRILGLPSRYVTGYIVSPGEFVQEDGGFKAIATDENAHAWVEVYVDGTGWVPTEVTFSTEEILQGGIGSDGDGGGDDDQNQSDGEEQTEGTSESSEETAEPTTEPASSSEASSDKTEDQNHTEDSSSQNSGFLGEILQLILKILLCAAAVAAVVLGLILFFRERRKRKLLNLKRKKTNILFIKMIEALHLAGYFKDCDGTEEDFPKKLSELVETVQEEDIALFVNLANKAAFGNKPVDKDSKLLVYDYYCKVTDFLPDKLGLLKKFYFKYIKVYH